MRVYLGFVGCKLNLAEVEALGRRLRQAGAELVDAPDGADLCLFNTCTVTGAAAGKSRRAVRQLLRRAPEARVVVSGCHATQAPAELAALSPRVLLVDNAHKEEIPALLGLAAAPHEPGGQPWGLRTRAFVKVQDGCDNHCTYCVVCIARGPQRSRPLEEIVQEAAQRVAEGYRELVLTGVHVGAYGRDCGPDLTHLVRALLERTEVRRLRLSSIEPHDLRADFLDLWSDPRLCPHLHLPLQSGCDATLQRMGRRYTASQFADLAAAARQAIPDLALTTDVIVGFPGETDDEFQDSLGFVQALAFARVHVFTYSPRPGTLAAAMPRQVPPEAARARHAALAAEAQASARRFAQRFVGREMPVLFEQRAGPADAAGVAAWVGLTGNYLRVWAPSAEDLGNRIRRVRLLQVQGGRVRGDVV
ncbi:MAG: tRNA (N(6)-L-threonylcarbamoyladenosine(37)-C(2))-methylthiotransferase MtaB [Chloroflexi bacterium]|nr:tRNA (N(6)-L-threonylcarbamoyladenosine(37)-C(2))-methylthiotransferase MtaB [Chloroflexota bacterium]